MLGAGEEKEIRFFSSIEKQGLYKVSIDTLKPAIIRILGNENQVYRIRHSLRSLRRAGAGL